MCRQTQIFIIITFVASLLSACGGGSSTNNTGVRPSDSVLLESQIVNSSSWEPGIAVDPNGNGFAIWYHQDANMVDNYIYVRRYMAGGGWGAAVTLAHLITANPSEKSLGCPAIGVDGAGNAIATWCEWDGSRYNVQAKRYIAGTGWQVTASMVSSGTESAFPQRTAVAANGDAIVIWSQSNGLWSNRFTLTNNWGLAPQQLDATGDTNQKPDLAIDANGNAIVLWTNGAGLQTKYYDASTGWDNNPTVIQADTGATYSPHVRFDGSGNALAMWLQDGDTSAAVRLDITLNHYNVSTHSWDTAQHFPALNGGTSISSTTYIKHTVDASGNALVIWYDNSTGVYQLKANQYLGGTSWGTTVTLSHAGYGDIAVDAAGNGIAVWLCDDPNVGTVCSNRFSPANGWGTMAAHNTEYTVYDGTIEPVLASNAAGNAFVVWTELKRMAAYRFP